MISYLLIGLTFFLGVIGSLFSVVQKDKAGETVRGVGGMPRLTLPGRVSLSLLTVSFIASLFAAHSSNSESEQAKNATSHIQGQLELNEGNLERAQKSLDQANQTIQNLQSQDLGQFNNIASGLVSTTRSVTAQLSAASNSITRVTRTSAVGLDQDIRRASTPIDSFWLNAFFVGGSQGSIQGTLKDHPRDLAAFRRLACNSPVPLKLTLYLMLSTSPSLSLKGTFEYRGSACSDSASIEPTLQGPVSVSAFPNYWTQSYFGKPCDVIGYGAPFTSNQLKDLTAQYHLTAGSFRGGSESQVSVEVEHAADQTRALAYLQGGLPKVMGFYELPLQEQGNVVREDLGIGAAFALGSLQIRSDEIAAFLYERTELRPEWSFWSFSGSSPFKERMLPNPLLVPQRDSILPERDISSSESRHFGDVCKSPPL